MAKGQIAQRRPCPILCIIGMTERVPLGIGGVPPSLEEFTWIPDLDRKSAARLIAEGTGGY